LSTERRVGAPPPRRRSTLGIGQNHFGCLLADHVNRADDEKSRNARKHRRTHHAQALRSVYAKIGTEHAVLLSRADRATARRMLSPSVVANVVSQFIVGLKMLARQFLCSNETLLLQAGGLTVARLYLDLLPVVLNSYLRRSLSFVSWYIARQLISVFAGEHSKSKLVARGHCSIRMLSASSLASLDKYVLIFKGPRYSLSRYRTSSLSEERSLWLGRVPGACCT